MLVMQIHESQNLVIPYIFLLHLLFVSFGNAYLLLFTYESYETERGKIA